MGGRGASAQSIKANPQYTVDRTFYDTGEIEGVKILKGIPGTGKHGLPEIAHSGKAYIKLDQNGIFKEMRLYDSNRNLYLEIAYHREKNLTGNNNQPVLHYHTYDTSFSQGNGGNGNRSPARPITEEMKKAYGKYFKGVEL